MSLRPDQEAAAVVFMDFLLGDETEMVIDGNPGTGKTYLVKHLINAAVDSTKFLNTLLDEDNEINIAITATTNKAAAILSEAIDESVSTIHSLLKLKVAKNVSTGKVGISAKNARSVLKNTLLFIDEASYIDEDLFNQIRRYTEGCKVVYVGDSYQLTPVNSDTHPVFTEIDRKATLTEAKRFADDSAISDLGAGYRTAIDSGQFPRIEPDNKNIFWVDGPEFQKMINEEFSSMDIMEEKAKIVAWTNKRVVEYNNYVRGLHFSSPGFHIDETVITNKPIIAIDKLSGFNRVISTESKAVITDMWDDTNYGIHGWIITLKSDIGTVEVFQPKDPLEVRALLKSLKTAIKNKAESFTFPHWGPMKPDWSLFFSVDESMADLRPVYASTVHKAQGSTYENIYIDFADIGRCHDKDTVARLLHVAVTRAKEKVVIYGVPPSKYYS